MSVENKLAIQIEIFINNFETSTMTHNNYDAMRRPLLLFKYIRNCDL